MIPEEYFFYSIQTLCLFLRLGDIWGRFGIVWSVYTLALSRFTTITHSKPSCPHPHLYVSRQNVTTLFHVSVFSNTLAVNLEFRRPSFSPSNRIKNEWSACISTNGVYVRVNVALSVYCNPCWLTQSGLSSQWMGQTAVSCLYENDIENLTPGAIM